MDEFKSKIRTSKSSIASLKKQAKKLNDKMDKNEEARKFIKGYAWAKNHAKVMRAVKKMNKAASKLDDFGCKIKYSTKDHKYQNVGKCKGLSKNINKMFTKRWNKFVAAKKELQQAINKRANDKKRFNRIKGDKKNQKQHTKAKQLINHYNKLDDILEKIIEHLEKVIAIYENSHYKNLPGLVSRWYKSTNRHAYYAKSERGNVANLYNSSMQAKRNRNNYWRHRQANYSAWIGQRNICHARRRSWGRYYCICTY